MDKIFTNLYNIDVFSTSSSTADVTPIILNETDKIKTSFIPTIIDNTKNRECCLNGKLIHEKKQKKDSSFPSDKISKKDVKIGDIMEIYLSSLETKKLFDGLKEIYKLYNDIGVIPSGDNSYAKVDRSLLNIIRNFSNIKDDCSIDELTECISLLSKSLINKENLDTLSEKLKQCSNLNELSKLTDIVNISKLKSSLDFFKINIGNSDEEFWQNFLTNNQWIISQIFSYPATIYKDKAFVGGKDIKNVNGKIVDYLYRNDLTKNIALIEIKTPTTNLLGNEYRTNIYSLSNELSGGINQLLKYKDTLLKDWHMISENNDIINFNPNCVLIIGNNSELNNQDKVSSFELLRSNLKDVIIITFDELQGKINNLVNTLSQNS